MNSHDVIEALEHLRRFMPNGFILICDHAPIHTSQMTLAYFFDHPEIVVEPLPKYAPELNPEECCHGNVKAWEAKATPNDRSDMRRYWIAALRACAGDPICCWASFMRLAYLLGNFGETE